MTDKLYLQTPIFKSHKLQQEKGLHVFYKMDCYQPTGSFKIRGMEELCRFHINNGKRDFVASSGGNAGYSLAYVGKQLGANVKVVVPKSTSEFMINKITNIGAEVEVFGEVWDEAHHHALNRSRELNAVYVSPFDDPLLWKGHSSIIDECARRMEQPDKIVVSVGGGGLLCGILEGIENSGWKSTQVIAVETEGAASFYASHKAGKLVELEEITSIATSLGAKKVTKSALELSHDFDLKPFLVSDQDAIDACYDFSKEYNTIVEPACGASLSVPYFHSDTVGPGEKVLVIVCGGANIQIEALVKAS